MSAPTPLPADKGGAARTDEAAHPVAQPAQRDSLQRSPMSLRLQSLDHSDRIRSSVGNRGHLPPRMQSLAESPSADRPLLGANADTAGTDVRTETQLRLQSLDTTDRVRSSGQTASATITEECSGFEDEVIAERQGSSSSPPAAAAAAQRRTTRQGTENSLWKRQPAAVDWDEKDALSCAHEDNLPAGRSGTFDDDFDPMESPKGDFGPSASAAFVRMSSSSSAAASRSGRGGMFRARRHSFSDLGDCEEENAETEANTELQWRARRKAVLVALFIAVLLGVSMVCAYIETLRLPLCAFQCVGIALAQIKWETYAWIPTKPGRPTRICAQCTLTIIPLLIGMGLAYLAVHHITDEDELYACHNVEDIAACELEEALS